MKDRIKKIRQELKLTQKKFGQEIGMKQNTIAQYEMGRTIPSDAVIFSICREFKVSEEWLRTGQGDMFVAKTRSQAIKDFIDDLVEEPTFFTTRLAELLAKLDVSDWEEIERIVVKLASEPK